MDWPQAFGFLDPRDQVYLHDYFRPSEALAAKDLLTHRAQITKGRPSLPQCAGRALRELERALESRQVVREGGGGLEVVAVVRPTVDLDRMDRAIRQIVWDLDKQDRNAD